MHADTRPPSTRTPRPRPGLSKLNSVAQPNPRLLANTQAFDELDVVLGEPTHRTSKLINGAGAYRSKSSGIPRKEVIQPQLPLRLPCYDFTPIINPTFDGCLPEG